MAFNQQEQEIIKYGVSNGKTKEEVLQAIANYRSGVIPKKDAKAEDASGNIGDVAVGFAKKAGSTLASTASTIQDVGQGALGLGESILTGKDISQTSAFRPNVGIEALKQETPQGQDLTSSLQPTNENQKLGGKVETAAEILAGGGAGLIKDAVVGTSNAIARGVTPALKSVKPVGEFLYARAFTPNVAEAERILAYEATQPSVASKLYGAGELVGNPVFKPITVADTALRSGIAGTEKQIGVQAKQVADTLYKKEIAPAVKKIKGSITKEELFAPLISRIEKIVDPTKKSSYKNAFDSLTEDYKDVVKFSFEEAQKLKSELAEFTPAKVFRGQDVANETRMLQADMASLIREKTYEALKDVNVKQKYIDYGNLQELQKVGIKAITDAGTKGGFGGFWSTIYDTILTPVKTISGKTLYNIGDKLELVAPKGFEGKTVKDYLISIGYLAPQIAEEVVTEQQQSQ